MGRNHDYERAFHCARFIESHFEDKQIFEAADRFLTEKKKEIHGNCQSKCSVANQYKKVLRMFFDTIRLEGITKQEICKKLEKYSKPWDVRLHFMWEFLFFLKDLGKLGVEWEQLEHLREKLCSSPSGALSKRVLSVPDSSRYYLLKFGVHTRLYYLDSGNAIIQALMIEFLGKRGYFPDDRDHIVSFLFESCGIRLTSVEDIDYAMFCQQVSLLDENTNRKKYLAQVIDFYRFIYTNYNANLFVETSEFDARLLLRHGLAADLAEWFRIVLYNPLAPYPRHDRWIVNVYAFNEQYGKNITLSHKVDFTKVKSERYRDYLKVFLWTNPAPWKTKIVNSLNIIYFLNYISDVKSGKELTIFTQKTADEGFHVEEMAAYRHHIVSKYPNIKTQSHYFGDVAGFMEHLQGLGAITVDKGIFVYLKMRLARNTDKCPVSDINLRKISEVMKGHTSTGIKFALYYSVFYLGLETEFRISQIINLEADCVRETMKAGQHIVFSKSKNSGGECKEQAITSFTKRHLDEIRHITEDFRQRCPDQRMRSLLFLEPYRENENRFRPLSAEGFNKYFKKCCAEAGTPPYAFSNLRDTHMTKAEEFIIRKGLSDMYLRALTDHKSSDTTRRHYSEIELTEMLEAVYGIIIGDVRIEGTVVPEMKTGQLETDTISNGCGYCRNLICTTKTHLDCLMCLHFVTTPDRIPYFEEQLKTLDYRISMTVMAHDKEDLVTIKRLFAAYLRELLLVRGDVEYDSGH